MTESVVTLKSFALGKESPLAETDLTGKTGTSRQFFNSLVKDRRRLGGRARMVDDAGASSVMPPARRQCNLNDTRSLPIRRFAAWAAGPAQPKNAAYPFSQRQR